MTSTHHLDLEKIVLAFGDSLTWGSNPAGGGRHAHADRWTSVLEAGLGGGVRVIAEGLGGRTTMYDDDSGPADRNGARALPIVLGSHYPLDLVIIMLGTNDLKPARCGTAAGVAAGVVRLLGIVADYAYGWGAQAPRTLVVAPPMRGEDGAWVSAGGRDPGEARGLAPALAGIAARNGSAFFDASEVACCGAFDGVHLDAANTRAIGAALVPVVAGLLGLSSPAATWSVPHV